MLAMILRAILLVLAFACAWALAQLVMSRLQAVSAMRPTLSMDDILRDRLMCFLLFASIGVVISYASTPWLLPAALAAAYVLSKRAPAMLDARARQELRSACDEQADVMADIVAMGVRSGLSFDAAVSLYCAKFDNELACELRAAHMQWTSGLAPRGKALEDFSSRIGSKALRRFSDTSLQAIQHGSPLADMLDRFSADMRRRRKSAVERQVEKAPVKMLVPMGACILPAMLILVMGPVILQFVQTGY